MLLSNNLLVSQVSYNFPFPLELIRSSVEEKATGSWQRCRSMSPACGGRTWGGCVTLAGGTRGTLAKSKQREDDDGPLVWPSDPDIHLPE